MPSEPSAGNWSLEVVRGAEAGRRFALAGGTVLLGNALNGAPGIDLADQEANSPRKMAARQAQIHVANGSLSLRDLGSPGGTFVDRRRVPSGSDLPLKEGDVIQLGGVQLRVTSQNGTSPRPAAPPSSPSAAFLFTLKGGASCRSWDDFLAVSAQRWADLRDELTSGRLAAFLASIGRGDLAPDPRTPGSPDERLDAWIGRLPTTREAKPELEVHPRTVVVRAQAGGGVVRKKIQVSNSGYRLLRASARVEPPGATWLAIAPEFAGREFFVSDAIDLAIDATLPESTAKLETATLVIEGNGGTARVSVAVEPISARVDEPVREAKAARISFGLRERIARVPIVNRLKAAVFAAVGGRALVAGLNGLIPAPGAAPALIGPAVGFALIGAMFGVWGRKAR